MTSISTSPHRLSADRGLSRMQRLYWFACNLANIAFPRSFVDGRMKERRFHVTPGQLDRHLGDIAPQASPSRTLSDLFWLSLPWDAILAELGPVSALEIGCGTGRYGLLLADLVGEDLARYRGVDIEAQASWKGADPRLEFSVGRACDADRYLPAANLVLTQSAIEHFEEDLLLFAQIARAIRDTSRPILQVHLFPSASCITTFPWHGIREYTPRTISKVTALFGPESRTYLFSLGGSACNHVHRKYITWPHYLRGSDLRKARPDEYRSSLRSAILSDLGDQASGAAFYALVLVSHFDADPFARDSREWSAQPSHVAV